MSENDLLNVTQQKNETLPQNSAALESAIPTEAARPEEEPDNILTDGLDGISEQIFGTETEAAEMTDTEEKKDGTVLFYVILCVLGAAAIGEGYYFKVVKKRKELYLDDDDPYYEDYGEDEEDWKYEEDKKVGKNERNKEDKEEGKYEEDKKVERNEEDEKFEKNGEVKEAEHDNSRKQHEEKEDDNEIETDFDSMRVNDKEKASSGKRNVVKRRKKNPGA